MDLEKGKLFVNAEIKSLTGRENIRNNLIEGITVHKPYSRQRSLNPKHTISDQK